MVSQTGATEGGVDAAGIAESCDLPEDRAQGHGARRPVAAIHDVRLEGSEESLGDGVVPAVVGLAVTDRI